RRAALLVGLLAAVTLVALVPAVQLVRSIDTDLAELLPGNHPGVLAYRRLAGRQKSSTNLVLLVNSTDPAAARRFADALDPRLRELVPEVFTDVQWQPDNEIPDHASKWRWLYADLKDLEDAEGLFDRVIAARTGAAEILDGDPEAELKALRQR